MNFKKFEHKNILITGASSGIGEAMAYQFAHVTANLFLTGRNTERLSAIRNQCDTVRNSRLNASQNLNSPEKLNSSGKFETLNCSTQLFIVDFSDTSSIDNFVSKLAKVQLAFDYIILNAGISQRALTLDTDMEVDRKIMETNYFGPVYLIKKMAEVLKFDRPLHIAVTSSISGLFGFPLRSAYCASKHALFGFFESLELENENIKVTFLIPGRINTPISKSALLGDGAAYSKMDGGQANGMDVNKCARIAIRSIAKGKRRKLIGGKELLMVYLKKYVPLLFYWMARRVDS